MIILNEDTAQTIEINSTVLVRNPATDSFVEVKVEDGSHPLFPSFDGNLILTTADSNVEFDDLNVDNYGEHVRHLRGRTGHAVLSRDELQAVLKSGEYTIG